MRTPNYFSLLFLSSILCYWFQPTFQLLARRRFFKQARFVIDSLHQLTTTPFQIYNVSNSFDCTLKCIEHDQCLSFNMAVDSSGGLKLCQLLSTDKYNSSKDFRASNEFDYHSISVGLKPGELNPCKNGGSFNLFYWTGNYSCTCPPNIGGDHCEWIKLNSNPVHVQAKDDKYGVFNAIKSGQIFKFKLVYISGGMTCWVGGPNHPKTNFGCGSNLHVLITNTFDAIISPPTSYVHPTYAVYSLPGVTSNDPVLILPEIDSALQVTAGQEFRVWYGEDLFNRPESDNAGTLDIDVYALYN